MSAINPSISSDLPLHQQQQDAGPDNYLTHGRGIMSWLLSLDHKRIGIMYMINILVGFFLGGVFAMIIRSILLTPGQNRSPQMLEFYNHVFTLHGAVMVFMFIIPGIPAIMGNFILPMMLGAKDVAFPRLNLLSFWLFFLGSCFFVYVLLSGVVHVASNGAVTLPGGFGLDTGWTFYSPYSTTKSTSGVVPAVLGAFIMGFASILTGVNFIASMHVGSPGTELEFAL